MNDLPVVSIITVVRNGRPVIGRTMRSVQALRWPRIQHILIDGASTDGTQDIIGQYPERVGCFLSEPDRGVYDAMNKGLAAAAGDYIWFLNAGDEAYDPEVLDRALAGDYEADLLYGNAMLVYLDGREAGLRRGGVPSRLEWRHFRHGMVVCHQAMIVRRAVAPEYEVCWRHVADIQWAMDALRRSGVVRFVEGPPLCRFLVGGLSARYKLPALWERFRLLQQRFGVLPNLAAHARIVGRRCGRLFRR